jgi:hypothetical protein
MTFFGYSVQLLSQRFESTIVDCERIDKNSKNAGGTVKAGRNAPTLDIQELFLHTRLAFLINCIAILLQRLNSISFT